MKELVAARYANKLAIYDGPSRATYASTSNASCASGTHYTSELGLSRGDPFAVMALNNHEFLELYHAPVRRHEARPHRVERTIWSIRPG
jgi:acyl-CoA synthetase (AMP-forming)/AMP-acid ligase II